MCNTAPIYLAVNSKEGWHYFLVYLGMSYITLSERLKNTSSANKKSVITNDETWAFTEQPKREPANGTDSPINAHDLFSLFTANIIKAKTNFIR